MATGSSLSLGRTRTKLDSVSAMGSNFSFSYGIFKPTTTDSSTTSQLYPITHDESILSSIVLSDLEIYLGSVSVLADYLTSSASITNPTLETTVFYYEYNNDITQNIDNVFSAVSITNPTLETTVVYYEYSNDITQNIDNVFSAASITNPTLETTISYIDYSIVNESVPGTIEAIYSTASITNPTLVVSA